MNAPIPWAEVVPVNELEGYPDNRRRRVIAFSIALVVAAAAVSTLLLRPDTRDELEADRLPDFTLAHLEGDGSLSADDLKGAPVVLNFWASWCGPCRAEARAFEAAWDEYRSAGVQFVGVNVCDLEPEARDFVEEFGVTYTIVRDPDQELADALGIECRLPQTFFVEPSGEFLASSAGAEVGAGAGGVVLGGLEAEDLEARIQQLLDEGG
jgi:peroxiredoxin